MNKAVLLSIRPNWCALIASGRKTLEVRKTRPKLDTPFKVYMYRTKPKDRLIDVIKDGDLNYGEVYHGKPVFIKANSRYRDYVRDGKIIGEFTCDRIDKFSIDEKFDNLTLCSMSKLSRVPVSQLQDYASGYWLYGWRISDFRLYDKPRELSEFSLSRPPQSWQYVVEP